MLLTEKQLRFYEDGTQWPFVPRPWIASAWSN